MILGLESSCDETAASVVSPDLRILSHVVYSQVADHQAFGGVVPEIASRCHVEVFPDVVENAMGDAGVTWSELTGIAVTRGPGLATSLLTGLTMAKALSARCRCPVVGVNHLDGHLASIRLSMSGPARTVRHPVLILLVSGGHTCLVLESAPGAWKLIGRTLDDAAGEALDKGAKLMGLSYPGGPAIQKAAEGAKPADLPFPRGLTGRSGPSKESGGLDRSFCFSFSGLKTSLMYHLRAHPEELHPDRIPSLAAAYQQAVVDTLMDRFERAADAFQPASIGCAGGVARNRLLRERLEAHGERCGLPLYLTEPVFCTDNAAMIAAAAVLSGDMGSVEPADLEIDPSLAVGQR